jgi:hypothetical protein
LVRAWPASGARIARVHDRSEAEITRLRRGRARRGHGGERALRVEGPADVVDAEREKLERYRRELSALDG